jgi:hypothetical protein
MIKNPANTALLLALVSHVAHSATDPSELQKNEKKLHDVADETRGIQAYQGITHAKDASKLLELEALVEKLKSEDKANELDQRKKELEELRKKMKRLDSESKVDYVSINKHYKGIDYTITGLPTVIKELIIQFVGGGLFIEEPACLRGRYVKHELKSLVDTHRFFHEHDFMLPGAWKSSKYFKKQLQWSLNSYYKPLECETLQIREKVHWYVKDDQDAIIVPVLENKGKILKIVGWQIIKDNCVQCKVIGSNFVKSTRRHQAIEFQQVATLMGLIKRDEAPTVSCSVLDATVFD